MLTPKRSLFELNSVAEIAASNFQMYAPEGHCAQAGGPPGVSSASNRLYSQLDRLKFRRRGPILSSSFVATSVPDSADDGKRGAGGGQGRSKREGREWGRREKNEGGWMRNGVGWGGVEMNAWGARIERIAKGSVLWTPAFVRSSQCILSAPAFHEMAFGMDRPIIPIRTL